MMIGTRLDLLVDILYEMVTDTLAYISDMYVQNM